MGDNGVSFEPIPLKNIFRMYKEGKITYAAYMLEKQRRAHGKAPKFCRQRFVPLIDTSTK